MDLDDMLDDIDIDDIESKPTDDEIFNAAAANMDEQDDFGDDLVEQMEMADLAEWTKAINDISPHIRDKWTNLIKIDNKTVNTNKMQSSYAYKMWSGFSNNNTNENVKNDSVAYKPTTSVVLHDMIRI